MVEALWYTPAVRAVICRLCPRQCVISVGRVGACGVRKNIQGKLTPLNYALVTAIANDPIEKKPLAYFNPGSMIVSLGSFGCNMQCVHCQNSEISQCAGKPAQAQQFTLNDLTYLVREKQLAQIAFTYNEPLVWYEYVLEASKRLKQSGVQMVLVSNGYINPEPLRELLPYTDAWSLDIKWAFDATAQKLSGVPKAQPVLDTARAIHAARKHLEIVTNIVPGFNDSMEELQHIAQCIAGISPDIPWHVSRAFPKYKWQGDPTSMSILEAAVEIGHNAGLKYVQKGNV